jgi:hypothetical protein
MYTFQSVYDDDSKNFIKAVKLCDAAQTRFMLHLGRCLREKGIPVFVLSVG